MIADYRANGLLYLPVKGQCQRCHNQCDVIYRPQFAGMFLALLSDCCSNPVKLHKEASDGCVGREAPAR